MHPVPTIAPFAATSSVRISKMLRAASKIALNVVMLFAHRAKLQQIVNQIVALADMASVIHQKRTLVIVLVIVQPFAVIVFVNTLRRIMALVQGIAPPPAESTRRVIVVNLPALAPPIVLNLAVMVSAILWKVRTLPAQRTVVAMVFVPTGRTLPLAQGNAMRSAATVLVASRKMKIITIVPPIVQTSAGMGCAATLPLQ